MLVITFSYPLVRCLNLPHTRSWQKAGSRAVAYKYTAEHDEVLKYLLESVPEKI